ncbi:zf-HC2 domain-containing protein [Neobacillus sp. D3-1R]|uniref:zf-HC2 domain-containing protein n=1 Tax=Neobacillus sp. D3-1R TaxID=3445778 RepID=UPI003F9FBA33
MKKPCDIVQDLLPLYLEGMLKKETATFVKDHLDNCAHCKSVKIRLEKTNPWKLDYRIPKESFMSHGGEKELITRIKKWKRRTSIVGILLLLIISLLSWFIGKTFNPQPVIKPTIEQKTSMIRTTDEIQDLRSWGT